MIKNKQKKTSAMRFFRQVEVVLRMRLVVVISKFMFQWQFQSKLRPCSIRFR